MNWRPIRLGVFLLFPLALAGPTSAFWHSTRSIGNGAGLTTFHPPRTINPADVGLPPGYCLEAVAVGLTYPSAVVVDDQDRVYVVEAGYSYGEDFAVPRLLRLEPDGRLTVIACAEKGTCWTGACFHHGAIYLSASDRFRAGRILRVTLAGQITVLLEGIPSFGEHHTDRAVVGPDNWIYFGVGSATNSGVVGPDDAQFGWLKRFPQACDIPPHDIVLTGQNYRSDDALHAERGEVLTGAFVPYGTATYPGQIIKGRLPCTSAILRFPLHGGPLELVAWGFRDPFGLAFSPDGQLYTIDNSYDDRGSRPVFGAGDLLWKVEPGVWYGFPDYWGNQPLTDRRFGENKKPKTCLPFLLAHHPNIPPEPVARLGVRSASCGFDFSLSPAFGHVGEAFIAVFGDMTGPSNGSVAHPVGCRVVRVNPHNGVIQDFAVNKGKEAGPASKEGGGGLERPIDCRFNSCGDTLYVADFGVMTRSEKGPRPYRETGVLWRIRRCPECSGIPHDCPCKRSPRRGEAIGRPILVSTECEARGEVTFMRNCYPCHQGGEGGLGPAITLVPSPVVRAEVRLGLGDMPAFCRKVLSPAELSDLVDYLKTVRRSPCSILPDE